MALNDNFNFAEGDYVVYPAHGVGQIEGVETQTIGGMDVSLYAISFEKERMRLKIPVMKAESSGLRKLSSSSRIDDAIKTLKGRARIRRTMWSRRAQEYETKINSGDPVAIAEVLRDLKRSSDDSEQSYSERQIYQSALERLAREVAAVQDTSEIEASNSLEDIMGIQRIDPEDLIADNDDEVATDEKAAA
ncbi:MAG: CarD family transcriptional regulator [Alphaproteobacteria bacterium]